MSMIPGASTRPAASMRCFASGGPMAEQQKQQPQWTLPGGPFLWLAALLAGSVYINHTQPFDTARPGGGQPQRQSSGFMEQVDARLWEDPFAAVARARSAT